MVITSIGHLINKVMLKDYHEKMDKDKTVGIDGITKEENGKNLEEDLGNLVEGFNYHYSNQGYHPCSAMMN